MLLMFGISILRAGCLSPCAYSLLVLAVVHSTCIVSPNGSKRQLHAVISHVHDVAYACQVQLDSVAKQSAEQNKWACRDWSGPIYCIPCHSLVQYTSFYIRRAWWSQLPVNGPPPPPHLSWFIGLVNELVRAMTVWPVSQGLYRSLSMRCFTAHLNWRPQPYKTIPPPPFSVTSCWLHDSSPKTLECRRNWEMNPLPAAQKHTTKFPSI